jgi:anaerobic selenocysteine-containing dehydrogenase
MKDRASPLTLAGDRRTFLKAAVAAGSATALSTLTTTSVAATDESLSPTTADTRTESRGYRETAHIKEYYKILRE